MVKKRIYILAVFVFVMVFALNPIPALASEVKLVDKVEFKLYGFECGKKIEKSNVTTDAPVSNIEIVISDQFNGPRTSEIFETNKEYYIFVNFEETTEICFDLQEEDITLNGKTPEILLKQSNMTLAIWIMKAPLHEHFYTEYNFDKEKHWKECGDQDCPEKEESVIDVAAHSFDKGSVTKEATETEAGVMTYTCTVCKATKTEAVPVVENDDNNKENGGTDAVTNVPAKNTVLKDEKTGFQYKVTTSSATNGTVEFTKPKDKKVKKVVVPDTVTINGITYKVTSIAKNAFNGFKRLEKVTIGKNVTTIGDKAFYKCTKLSKITIPAKVSKIGKQAFYGCKKLKSIKIKTKKLTSKKVGSKAFTGTPKNAKVKVPSKSLKSYKKFLYKKGLHKKAKITK